MIFISFACAVLLALVYLRSPLLHAAHAARADKVPFWVRATRRRLFFGPVKDRAGNRIDISNKMLGYAYGDSLPDDLPNGALFIASYLDDKTRPKLSAGDIVVVDAPAKASRVKKRLRVFDHIDMDGNAHFRPDRRGHGHRMRPQNQVVAKVDWATTRGREQLAAH